MGRSAMLALVLGVLTCTVGTAGEATAPSRDLQYLVRLLDGTWISGGGPEGTLRLFTDYGRLDLTLARLARLRANDDRETVTVTMRNGDVLHGVLDAGSLVVIPAGSGTALDVPLRHISSLAVSLPIRIAGDGNAWWDVSLLNALGFEAENVEGRLTVTGIEPASVNTAGGGAWSTVKLTRDVGSLDDFDLTAGISWDGGTAEARAMQSLFVTLLDAEGRTVASCGNYDAWSGCTGSRWSEVLGQRDGSGYGTQPATGRAVLGMERKNGRLRILWDGREKQAIDGSRMPVSRILVQFDFYPYRGGCERSTFGTASLFHLELH